MEATFCLSKPLSNSHIHTPTTIINRYQYATCHNPPSLHCFSFRTMPQQVSHHRNADVVGACSLMMRVGPVSLGGAPKTCSAIVGMKNPFTGRKGIKKRMPEWRSLTLEGLRRGYLPMNVLLEAKKARLQPRSLDNALSELVGLLNDMKHHLHRIEFSKLEVLSKLILSYLQI